MMREGEGRILSKPMAIQKLNTIATAVLQGVFGKNDALPEELPGEYQRIRTLVQKVRYKKYILTKEDMKWLNEVYERVKK